ncbi:MAG: TIM barrel protein [Thermomicrobiales bacterium]|nr:TIM barrel protein [Thermomicrobiales bacterium]MCO5220211.1 sugar phosphate isomerase/epimerase [Thermomicrobiales bacterium]
MQVAIQLYTVRDKTAEDMLGTLTRIGEIGYRSVEFAGYGNSEPNAIREAIDKAGIAGFAAHVALARIDDEFDTVVDEMRILGVEHLIVPWLPPDQRNRAGYDHLIETLNKRAPEARDAGLHLGYHNHDFEFIPIDGVFPFDRIAGNTDPALVSLEIDVGWVKYAGQDPVAIIEQHAGRVPLIHAKEEQVDGVAGLPAPGSGPLPWKEIVAAGKAAGAKYLIAEDDHPLDSMKTAQAAFENLTGLVA